MFDPALSVCSMLETKGLGEYAGNNPFDLCVGHPPDKPDAIVIVNLGGGHPPIPHLLLNYPSVQVVVRGKASGYVAASARMSAIVNALLGIKTLIVNGDTYQACNQLGDVGYLGQDDRTRPMLVANFSFIVEPAQMAGGNREPII